MNEAPADFDNVRNGACRAAAWSRWGWALTLCFPMQMIDGILGIAEGPVTISADVKKKVQSIANEVKEQFRGINNVGVLGSRLLALIHTL